jgi:two-component system cell cycle sensor histidine kinase/response regulator CckA
MNQSNFTPTLVLVQIVVFFFILFPGNIHEGLPSLAAEEMGSVHLTDKEKRWLEAHPTIRLAPDPSFQPIEFFDENGNYAGVGADYVKLIEKKLGLTFEIVHCASWDDVISRMQRQEVDVLNAVVRTPQREQYMHFPPPYLQIPSVIIVRKNVNKNLTLGMLEGLHVVMVSGYGYVDLIKNKFPKVDIELVPNLKAALRKVSIGMADAFVGDLATASFDIESEGITNLRLAGETDPPNISGFAVRSDWPELSSILEKGVQLITQEERNAIFKKWIHLEPEPGLTMRELWNLILIIVGVVALIIAGFLLWNLSLKRMVRHRTESLRKEIEERKQVEEALRQNEEQFRHFFEHLTIGVAVYEAIDDGEDFLFFDLNPVGEKLSKVSIEKIKGKRLSQVFPGAKALGLFKALENVWRTGCPEYVPFSRYEDERIQQWVENRVFKLPSGRVVAVYDDRTELIRLEEGLRQAQKMESVGRLAGGIAHDFNNMLSIISGNVELALMPEHDRDFIVTRLIEIQKAATRSTNLTRQLLAFARKQAIAPEILDLNEVIEGMLTMLSRLIGEDIDIDWLPKSGLWLINVDPTQVDQILTNLCVNARDAINGVGKITIATDNVFLDENYCRKHENCKPGEYAILAVSDNGCGMDKETLNNLFEPFFTKKDFGQGTGLGLSTVYGIVKQNNGVITVHSEPTKGTIFKLYFPKYTGNLRLAGEPPKAEALIGGTETILLVEDEEAILRMSSAILEHLGYTVITASGPVEAIRIVASFSGTIQLLLTDVVMPEMNGRDLAEKLLLMNPGMKCLFMSGYTAEVIADHGVLDGKIKFLNKPFLSDELARIVRETLDQ